MSTGVTAAAPLLTGKPVSIGVLTPHAAIGPEAELPQMAMGRVTVSIERLGTGNARGSPGSSPPSLNDLTALSRPEVLAEAARRLVAKGAGTIGYASTTTAYAIGFEAEAAIVARLVADTAVPVASSSAAAVLALRTLDVSRVALIGAPWFDQLFNDLGAAYFEGQGFDVVSSEPAALGNDPKQIDATSVVEWTAAHVSDEAEAVFVGGTGFPVVGAIGSLEALLGRPVLTANQVLLWQLLAAVASPTSVVGYGMLFERSPSTSGAA